MVVLAESLRPASTNRPCAQVQAELQAARRGERQVADYEQLHTLVVAREAWSIENGTADADHEDQARTHRGLVFEWHRRCRARGWYERQGVQWL
jgi:hypothetical protein